MINASPSSAPSSIPARPRTIRRPRESPTQSPGCRSSKRRRISASSAESPTTSDSTMSLAASATSSLMPSLLDAVMTWNEEVRTLAQSHPDFSSMVKLTASSDATTTSTHHHDGDDNDATTTTDKDHTALSWLGAPEFAAIDDLANGSHVQSPSSASSSNQSSFMTPASRSVQSQASLDKPLAALLDDPATLLSPRLGDLDLEAWSVTSVTGYVTEESMGPGIGHAFPLARSTTITTATTATSAPTTATAATASKEHLACAANRREASVHGNSPRSTTALAPPRQQDWHQHVPSAASAAAPSTPPQTPVEQSPSSLQPSSSSLSSSASFLSALSSPVPLQCLRDPALPAPSAACDAAECQCLNCHRMHASQTIDLMLYAFERRVLGRCACASPSRCRQTYSSLPPLRSYLYSLVMKTGVSVSCIVAAEIYIERLHREQPTLEIASCNAHRIWAVMLMLADKFLCDQPLANVYWGQLAGGYSLLDVNAMEREMLATMAWRMAISRSEYRRFLHELA